MITDETNRGDKLLRRGRTSGGAADWFTRYFNNFDAL